MQYETWSVIFGIIYDITALSIICCIVILFLRFQYQQRTRRIIQAAKLCYNKTSSNERLDLSVSHSPLSNVTHNDSVFDFEDSDKDSTYELSESNLNEIIDSSSHISFSNISEQSAEICQKAPLSIFSNNISNNVHESTETLINEDTDDIYNNSAHNSNFTVDNQINKNTEPHLNTSMIKKWRKKRTFCKFCTLDVTNFERYLERHHKDCKSVVEMLSYSKKSKERKLIIGLLRKEGHFNKYFRGNIRPIYETKTKKSDGPYYPCVSCKGLYSQKFLSRHHKKCHAVAINKDSRRINHLSASQTLIACALSSNNALHKMRVKEEVFDKMRADEISLVAKSDPLICHFGEQYLKKHNRNQLRVVCSNKIRELARLLIEFRQIKNNQNYKLTDMINPVIFDDVIECAKKLGGYDQDKKLYRAPSLSAHLGTSLKQASELLIRLILKQDPITKCYKDPEKKIKEVKRFGELISSQWTTEISSLAFKNLNATRWNRPTILPLTKDIMKFKDHVTQIANNAVVVLRDNSNNKIEFKRLVEATLILTILYNRRRIGDVQYTKLQTYHTHFSQGNQEECLNSLSESEKVLTKYYKRIVTGGKGSRPIVILFPQHLQDYVQTIINIRESTDLVPSKNPYLFAYSNSEQWARGDVAIRKYAQKANLEHPSAISSNKLRKQIATVMQILNLNQEETEQFATFMGHTEKTHNEFYKLPQDIYQTAKVSKLLILMDKGTGHKYKGKSLNDIDINPEDDLAESDSDQEEINEATPTESSVNNFVTKTPELPSINNARTCKQSGRIAWTKEQADVVKNHFKRHIQLKKPPKKNECEELLKKYPHLLRNKDWVRIKTYIYNTYRNK